MPFVLVLSDLPFEVKREEHDVHSILLASDDVFSTCICDNPKEIIKGMFHQNLKDALFQLN